MRFPNFAVSQCHLVSGPQNESLNLDNNENLEAPLPKETLPLENDLETLENQMREVSANQEQLNKNIFKINRTQARVTKIWNNLNCLNCKFSQFFEICYYLVLFLLDILIKFEEIFEFLAGHFRFLPRSKHVLRKTQSFF